MRRKELVAVSKNKYLYEVNFGYSKMLGTSSKPWTGVSFHFWASYSL